MSPFGDLFRVPRPPETSSQSSAGSIAALPLNLLALIISHVENVADLARLCQTSRVLHYMTLPQLYRNITLTSYAHIRYKDVDQAEGIGAASPFSMGLNALVTRSVCTLVRSLALQGDWREHDLEEFSRAGRVPDDAMLLSIVVRAAIDRCTLLESFKWDLNTKLLSTVYSGLAPLKHLRSFHLRFPNSRSPRPVVEIPPLPHLRSFTMTHYDPLCYPDDISTLLFAATKLHTLKMHFSPRMRDAAEPSVNMLSFFRHNLTAKRRIRLRTNHFYNLFALSHDKELSQVLDMSGAEHLTFLNTFGADDEDGMAGPGVNAGFLAFFDNSWLHGAKSIVTLKSMRHDRLSRRHAEMIARIKGLEELYLVNARYRSATSNAAALNPSPPDSSWTPSTSGNSNSNSTGTPPLPALTRAASSTALRDIYLDCICLHGATLKRLIVPARWPLPASILARLFRTCPHLTQLAVAVEGGFSGMRLLVPFLSKLMAIRILGGGCRTTEEGSEEEMEELISREVAREGLYDELRYVGVGGRAWVVGGLYESVEVIKGKRDGGGSEDEDEDEDEDEEDEEAEEQEVVVLRRRLRRAEPGEIEAVEIWKMDSLDVA